MRNIAPASRSTSNRYLIGLGAALLGLPLVVTTGASAAPRSASAPVSPALLAQEMTGVDAATNTSARWDVGATDLGIMWDDHDGHVLAAFGDTFSTPGPDGAGYGNWRSNVLLRSSDRELADGMTFDWAHTDATGKATEIIGSKKQEGVEVTSIPTAAIAVGSRQYLAYMSVRHWGPPGEWDTNFSQLAYSDDDGRTWTTQGAPRWDNNAQGTDPFQMVSFARRDGYVFMMGTQNGRMGAASLARVTEGSMLDKAAYEYWNGHRWASDYSAAAPVLPAKVAETSFRYDPALKLWELVYLNGNADLVLRTAHQPQGPWSDEQMLASQREYPGLYGGFIHPWSPAGTIYFAMSIWNQYNPALMKVELGPNGRIVRPNLLANPSFEVGATLDGTDAWQVSGTGGIDTNSDWAKLDRRQFWVRNTTGTQTVSQKVSVAPRTCYQMTAWLRTGDTVGGRAGTGAVGARDAVTGAAVTQQAFTDLDGWTKFTLRFNSGSSSALDVFAESTMTGDRWVRGDDFSLTQLPNRGHGKRGC